MENLSPLMDERAPRLMRPTDIAAAMGYACLTSEGLAMLAGLPSMDVYHVVTSPVGFGSPRNTLPQLTNALAKIGLQAAPFTNRVEGGPSVGWSSDVAQELWWRQLEKLPSMVRTR